MQTGKKHFDKAIDFVRNSLTLSKKNRQTKNIFQIKQYLERKIDRQRERQIEKKKERQTERKIYRQKERYIDRKKDRQTERCEERMLR